MSTPKPRAFSFVAAVSTITPSPEPRSTTKSSGPTLPMRSISSTTTCGVGTYGPPVRFASMSSAAPAIRAADSAARASSTRRRVDECPVRISLPYVTSHWKPSKNVLPNHTNHGKDRKPNHGHEGKSRLVLI